MSSSSVPARAKTRRLNKLAVAALVFAGIAGLGLWLFGVAVLAVFAVGAGHVSLNQIQSRGEKGRWLAIAALVIGYGIATLALITSLSFIPEVIRLTT